MRRKRRMMIREKKRELAKKHDKNMDKDDGEILSLGAGADAIYREDRTGDKPVASKSGLRCLASLRMEEKENKPVADPSKLKEMKVITALSESIAQGQKNKRKKFVSGDSKSYDIWDDDEVRGTAVEAAASKRRRASGAMPSVHKAAEPPGPGASYHPDPVAHKNLIKKAADFIIRKQKEDEKYEKKLRPLTAEGRPQRDRGMYIDDLRPKPTDHEEEHADDEDEAQTPIVADKPEERRTKAQRNKEARKKATALNLEKIRIKKQLARDIHRIKDLVEELDAQEEEHEIALQARRRKQQIKALTVPQKFGKLRAKIERPDVLLTEELPSSLRTLQSPAMLMQERFSNMQRRNLVPVIPDRDPRKKKRKVKAKFHSTEKWYTWSKDQQ